MRLLNRISSAIKRAIPTIGIAGLTVLPAACDTDDTRQDITESKIAKHNVELPFKDAQLDLGRYLNNNIYPDKLLQEYIDDENIDSIYLIPVVPWHSYTATDITNFRQNVLQPIMEMSPKLRGQGDFNFFRGEASKVPEDSLWFVANGWTINKRYQR